MQDVKDRISAQNILSKLKTGNVEAADEEDEGEFSDHRWRLLCLQPRGQRWQEFVATLDGIPNSPQGT